MLKVYFGFLIFMFVYLNLCAHSWKAYNGSHWNTDTLGYMLCQKKAGLNGSGMVLRRLKSYQRKYHCEVTFKYDHNPSSKNNFALHTMASFALNGDSVVGFESISIGVNQTDLSDQISLYHFHDDKYHLIHQTSWNWNDFINDTICFIVSENQYNTWIISINTLNKEDHKIDTVFLFDLPSFSHFGFSQNSTTSYVDALKVFKVEFGMEFYNNLEFIHTERISFDACDRLLVLFDHPIFHNNHVEFVWNGLKLNYRALNSRQCRVHLPKCMEHLETIDIQILKNDGLQEVIYLKLYALQEGDVLMNEILHTDNGFYLELKYKPAPTKDRVKLYLVNELNADTLLLTPEPIQDYQVFTSNMDKPAAFTYLSDLKFADVVHFKLLNLFKESIDEVHLDTKTLMLPNVKYDKTSIERNEEDAWDFSYSKEGHSLGSPNENFKKKETKRIIIHPEMDTMPIGTKHIKLLMKSTPLNWMLHYNIFHINGKLHKTAESNERIVASEVDIPIYGLSSGLYILIMEFFNLDGGYQKQKIPFVIY